MIVRRPLRLALVALLLTLRIVKQYEDHGRGPGRKEPYALGPMRLVAL